MGSAGPGTAGASPKVGMQSVQLSSQDRTRGIVGRANTLDVAEWLADVTREGRMEFSQILNLKGRKDPETLSADFLLTISIETLDEY